MFALECCFLIIIIIFITLINLHEFHATISASQYVLTHHPCLHAQLCVVMIFLVTVVMCRAIISVMMFHTGNPVLRTEVHTLCAM